MEERKITLVDDEQTLEFYVLEETKLNGSDYLLVTDTEDEEEEADCYILKDMSREGEGDAIGAVVIMSREPRAKFSEGELRLAATAAGFLGRQMES